MAWPRWGPPNGLPLLQVDGPLELNDQVATELIKRGPNGPELRLDPPVEPIKVSFAIKLVHQTVHKHLILDPAARGESLPLTVREGMGGETTEVDRLLERLVVLPRNQAT